MVSNPFGKPGGKKDEDFQCVKRHLKNWIYTWMSSVETEAEYETSKGLLFNWLGSTTVLRASTKTIAKNIKRWIVGKILGFVVKCLLHRRLQLRAYDEYVNSVAEIEVSSMKAGETIKPYMTLPTTCKNIRDKQDMRNNRKTTDALQRVGSTPLWSTTETATVVTKHAEGILQHEFLLAKKEERYSCVRIDSNTWLVRGTIVRQEQNWQHKKNITIPNPVPVFVRTRTIRLVDGHLLCSCAFYERFGLPCRHQFVVLGRGPTARDCAVRWRQDYLAYYRQGNKVLDGEFTKAKESEPIGPIYGQSTWMPTSYPCFLQGVNDIGYFNEPMNSTMYWIEGAETVLHTTMHRGVVMPTNPLVTEITMSQLSQISQEEAIEEEATLGTYRLDETFLNLDANV
jgi:hypothetical protein